MDLSRYLGLFVTDAREHLAGIESEAVRLEATDDPGERRLLLDAIFRHLHSLKSSAATMGFDPLAQLAHLAEALIVSARDGARRLSATEIDLLLETTDELARLVVQVGDGQRPAARPLLADRLARAGEKLSLPPPPAAPVATAGPAAVFDFPVTRARVRVSARSSTPAARAFLALRKLEAVGEIVASEPSRDALREGGLPGGVLTVTLRGAVPLEALAAAVQRVPDLDGVELVAEVAPPAEPARPEGRAEASGAASGEQVVRVRVELLDKLLELAGELVLASSRIREGTRPLPQPSRGQLEEEADRLRLLVKELNNRVLAARQTPIAQLFERLPRAVRDLSRRVGKPLELVVEGADVTLDRGLVEGLAEPLQHALRNAADHGIESAEERAAAGKPAAGRLTVSARRERERVVLELRDDGRGFDLDRLKTKAIGAGVVTAEDAAGLSDEAAHRLALLPGLSTREQADDVSGRGVGLDAVLRGAEQAGGTLQVTSVRGQGSCVRFLVPASVSLVNLLLVGLGREVFGVPMGRVLLATEADLSARGGEGFGARTIQVGSERIPSYPLGKLLGLADTAGAGPRPFIVVEAEGQRTAVGVDRVLGQEEVVLRPLGMPLERIRGLSGTAILGSGRPIFVLDVPRLVA